MPDVSHPLPGNASRFDTLGMFEVCLSVLEDKMPAGELWFVVSGAWRCGFCECVVFCIAPEQWREILEISALRAQSDICCALVVLFLCCAFPPDTLTDEN